MSQVRILAGSANGQEAFLELWNTDTNSNGVFNLAIGNGLNISGDLALLDWGNTSYFLEIAIDPTGGTTHVVIGASELNVVPIAMTSLQFEEQVGNTNVIQLAQTVVLSAGNITTLNNTSVNHGARILSLENQNLDARLTLAETEIVQNATAIALNTAKETNATHTGDVTGATELTITDNAVTNTKINIGAVTSSSIADGSIITADLDVDEISGGTDDLASDEELAAQALNVNGTPFTISMFTTASTVGDSQISDNGNTVFIGNNPSNGNLNLQGDLNYSGNLISNGSGNLFLNSWDVYTDSNVFSLNESGVAPRLSVLPGGNVGIRVENPTQALDVLGNINASGDIYLKGEKIVSNDGFGRLKFFDQNSLEHLEMNGFNTYFSNVNVMVDKKLGIGNGVNEPSATLDVVGTVKIADGTEGYAKVLTSDGFGFANWQPLPNTNQLVDGDNNTKIQVEGKYK